MCMTSTLFGDDLARAFASASYRSQEIRLCEHQTQVSLQPNLHRASHPQHGGRLCPHPRCSRASRRFDDSRSFDAGSDRCPNPVDRRLLANHGLAHLLTGQYVIPAIRPA